MCHERLDGPQIFWVGNERSFLNNIKSLFNSEIHSLCLWLTCDIIFMLYAMTFWHLSPWTWKCSLRQKFECSAAWITGLFRMEMLKKMKNTWMQWTLAWSALYYVENFIFLTLRLQIPNILNNSVGICIMYKHQNIRNYVTTIQDTNFNQMKEMQDKIFAQRESTMFTWSKIKKLLICKYGTEYTR